MAYNDVQKFVYTLHVHGEGAGRAQCAQDEQRPSITAIDRLCKGQSHTQPNMAQRQTACSTEVTDEAVQSQQNQAKDGQDAGANNGACVWTMNAASVA